MRLNGFIALIILSVATTADAANEPYAGVILDKSNSTTPKAEFAPNNITDIMPSLNKKSVPDGEIYFSADELETDNDEETITAIGNVVVKRDDMTLVADKLWYNQVHDKVVAKGNVVVTEGDGSVLYTDEIALTEKMSRAEVNKVKVIMHDESQIWADKFIKKPSNNKQMRNASYTACDMCSGKSPLWQIDARKVNYDAKALNINYNDAVLKVKGVPVF
jgi:LPS-assembly protein